MTGYVYAVVTRVPGDEGNDGNANTVDGSFCLRDGNLLGGGEEDVEIQRSFMQAFPVLGAHLGTPVFELGELLVLDAEYGREVLGRGRKPSKWYVDTENFATIEEATARAIEVTRNPPPPFDPINPPPPLTSLAGATPEEQTAILDAYARIAPAKVLAIETAIRGDDYASRNFLRTVTVILTLGEESAFISVTSYMENTGGFDFYLRRPVDERYVPNAADYTTAVAHANARDEEHPVPENLIPTVEKARRFVELLIDTEAWPVVNPGETLTMWAPG